MRNKYRDEIATLNQGGVGTYNNIIQFSQSCKDLLNTPEGEIAGLRGSGMMDLFLEEGADGQVRVNEFGDLCMATVSYLDEMFRVLQLEGPEYTQIDYFNTIVPGGLRWGDQSRDFSQMYGSWRNLTLMPIKVKAMLNLILPVPTMTLGRSDYFIRNYFREDTTFSLSTLFPSDYLKIIRQIVDSGVNIDNPNREPSIGRSLQYLGYYLRFQNITRDTQFFPSEILDSVSDLTQFRFSYSLIQVDANKDEPGSDYAKSFRGSIFNYFNSRGSETLGPVYLYTYDRLIMNAQNNSLALQLSPVRWYSGTAGVAYSIKLDYAPNFNFEELETHSPRQFFIDEYQEALKACIKGDNDAEDNGLESWFTSSNSNESYQGIKIPTNIERLGSAGYQEINTSINENLQTFVEVRERQAEESGVEPFDIRNCDNALKKQTVLVLSAALMLGYYFPETSNYLELGGR
jgi:hypothetical protein